MEGTENMPAHDTNIRPYLLYVWYLGIAGGLMGFPGCGPVLPPADPALVAEGSPVHLQVVADWDDLDAALPVGLTDAECAKIEELPGGTADRRAWKVLSIAEEYGTVTAMRVGPAKPDGKGSCTIRLEARIGRNGNPDREARLVQGMERRLNQLAGVDWAPGDEEMEP